MGQWSREPSVQVIPPSTGEKCPTSLSTFNLAGRYRSIVELAPLPIAHCGRSSTRDRLQHRIRKPRALPRLENRDNNTDHGTG
jgi:hypothetical protein